MTPQSPYRESTLPLQMSELYVPHPWQALVGAVLFTPIQWAVATLFHNPFTLTLFLLTMGMYVLVWPLFYLRRRSPRYPHPWRRQVVAEFYPDSPRLRQWAGGHWGLVRRDVDDFNTSWSVLRWEPVDDQFQGTTENWG